MRHRPDHPSLAAVRRLARLVAGCLALTLAACVQQGPKTGPLAGFAEFQGREVRRVDFEGKLVVPRDTLRLTIATQATSCRLLLLPVCPFGLGRTRHTLDVAELSRDVARIQLEHRDRGYYGTQVTPDVEAAGDGVDVRFTIVPGHLVKVRSLEVTGTEGILTADQATRAIPLRVGDPFRRIGFLAAADTVRGRLLDQGYAYAQVLRNYSLDTIADFADVSYAAVPGPVVRVDTIVVLGASRLGETTTRRELTFTQGSLLKASELNRSQRNLYGLQMVSFATVELAPDSLQVNPDSASATVLVRVVEAPQYLAEVSGGYGTIDCLRTTARRLDRNFLGGGRTLEISASASKIGAGPPLDGGLQNNLCRALQSDTLGNVLNYRAAADFVQPRLFGTHTSTALSVFTERVSEFQIYRRNATGGRASVLREIAPQTLASAALNVSRGRTVAEPIYFCVGLEICRTEAIDTLRRSRWSNFATLSLVRDRTGSDVYPTHGYQVRGSVDWATMLLGSDDRFLRLLTDASAYRQLRPGWVLAGRVQGGTFLHGGLGSEGYIPPERRFYAGGPNSVRGFRRNGLGPAVYVAVPKLKVDTVKAPDDTVDIRPSAVGGTRIALGSLELRAPSPVLRGNLQLAAFVDAARVWGSKLDTLIHSPPVRFTPGLGVRLLTPVGPIRVDAAYNPYAGEVGPLYGFDEERQLVLKQRRYDPGNQFVSRIQLYIAVGQAF
ncbi:MAG: BamA/TamA family outer membrane protein [Gemmatimonadetes bacterium]|nr:BamA/TamA family outer membrane protein [Gemmatimonadota bacterium]